MTTAEIERVNKYYPSSTDDIYSTNINGNSFTQKEYVAFMTDRSNIRKCENCPENMGRKSIWGYKCGQQNCEVACTCKQLGIKKN